jgi:hypothetical protein
MEEEAPVPDEGKIQVLVPQIKLTMKKKVDHPFLVTNLHRDFRPPNASKQDKVTWIEEVESHVNSFGTKKVDAKEDLLDLKFLKWGFSCGIKSIPNPVLQIQETRLLPGFQALQDRLFDPAEDNNLPNASVGSHVLLDTVASLPFDVHKLLQWKAKYQDQTDEKLLLLFFQENEYKDSDTMRKELFQCIRMTTPFHLDCLYRWRTLLPTNVNNVWSIEKVPPWVEFVPEWNVLVQIWNEWPQELLGYTLYQRDVWSTSGTAVQPAWAFAHRVFLHRYRYWVHQQKRVRGDVPSYLSLEHYEKFQHLLPFPLLLNMDDYEQMKNRWGNYHHAPVTTNEDETTTFDGQDPYYPEEWIASQTFGDELAANFSYHGILEILTHEIGKNFSLFLSNRIKQLRSEQSPSYFLPEEDPFLNASDDVKARDSLFETEIKTLLPTELTLRKQWSKQEDDEAKTSLPLVDLLQERRQKMLTKTFNVLSPRSEFAPGRRTYVAEIWRMISPRHQKEYAKMYLAHKSRKREQRNQTLVNSYAISRGLPFSDILKFLPEVFQQSDRNALEAKYNQKPNYYKGLKVVLQQERATWTAAFQALQERDVRRTFHVTLKYCPEEVKARFRVMRLYSRNELVGMNFLTDGKKRHKSPKIITKKTKRLDTRETIVNHIRNLSIMEREKHNSYFFYGEYDVKTNRTQVWAAKTKGVKTVRHNKAIVKKARQPSRSRSRSPSPSVRVTGYFDANLCQVEFLTKESVQVIRALYQYKSRNEKFIIMDTVNEKGKFEFLRSWQIQRQVGENFLQWLQTSSPQDQPFLLLTLDGLPDFENEYCSGEETKTSITKRQIRYSLKEIRGYEGINNNKLKTESPVPRLVRLEQEWKDDRDEDKNRKILRYFESLQHWEWERSTPPKEASHLYVLLSLLYRLLRFRIFIAANDYTLNTYNGDEEEKNTQIFELLVKQLSRSYRRDFQAVFDKNQNPLRQRLVNLEFFVRKIILKEAANWTDFLQQQKTKLFVSFQVQNEQKAEEEKKQFRLQPLQRPLTILLPYMTAYLPESKRENKKAITRGEAEWILDIEMKRFAVTKVTTSANFDQQIENQKRDEINEEKKASEVFWTLSPNLEKKVYWNGDVNPNDLKYNHPNDTLLLTRVMARKRHLETFTQYKDRLRAELDNEERNQLPPHVPPLPPLPLPDVVDPLDPIVVDDNENPFQLPLPQPLPIFDLLIPDDNFYSDLSVEDFSADDVANQF